MLPTYHCKSTVFVLGLIKIVFPNAVSIFGLRFSVKKITLLEYYVRKSRFGYVWEFDDLFVTRKLCLMTTPITPQRLPMERVNVKFWLKHSDRL